MVLVVLKKHRMKRIGWSVLLLMLWISVLSLWWCSFLQEKTEMSFDQAYDVFVDGLFSSQIFDLDAIMNSSQIKDSLWVRLQWENKDMQVQWNLHMNSLTDLMSWDSKTTADFSVNRYDKIQQAPLTFSGSLEFLFLKKLLYTKIDAFDMDSSKNTEANLVKLILENYMHTWILMDTTGNMSINHTDTALISSTYQIPQKIQSSLQKHKIFTIKKLTTTQKEQKFPLQINPREFTLFLDDLWVDAFDKMSRWLFSWMELDAYLLVEDKKTVSLVVDQLSLEGGDIILQWILGPRTISLHILDTKDQTEDTLSFKERRRSVLLDGSFENANKEKTIFSLDIDPELTDLGISFDFDGSITISPLNFYSPLVLDLDGNYRIEKTEFDSFVVPENTLLFNQLLGDQFALPAVIENSKE